MGENYSDGCEEIQDENSGIYAERGERGWEIGLGGWDGCCCSDRSKERVNIYCW